MPDPKIPEPEKVYELATPVPATPCWAVYADYDGDAPDTEDLVLCAHEDIAKEVCVLLRGVGATNDLPVTYRDEFWENFSLPYVDGHQNSRNFKCHRAVYELSKEEQVLTICRSVSAALEAIGGQSFTEELGPDDCPECRQPAGQCLSTCGQREEEN